MKERFEIIERTLWNMTDDQRDYRIDLSKKPQGRYRYYRDPTTGKLLNEYYQEVDEKELSMAENVTIEQTQSAEFLANSEKYVAELNKYGLTDKEARYFITEHYKEHKGKAKAQAKHIWQQINWRAKSYDTPYPPDEYYNSDLDHFRGINNRPPKIPR